MLHWPRCAGGSQTGVGLMQQEYAVQSDISIDMKLPRQNAGQTSTKEFALRISLFCVVGLSMYFGWVFCLFWSPSILPAGVFGDFDAHVIRAAMTVSMFVAYAVFGLFSRVFASSRGETLLRAVALVCCPCACVAWLLPSGIGLLWACLLWSVGGVGSSALLLVWSKKLVTLNRKQVVFSASSAFLLGSLLLGTAAFMPAGVAFAAIAFTPVASVAFAWLSFSPSAMGTQTEVDCELCMLQEETDAENAGAASHATFAKTFGEASEEDAEARWRLVYPRTILIAFSYSVGIGFVGSCATVQAYSPFAIYVIMAGNAMASMFTVFFLLRERRDIALVLTQAFLPIMLVCIFVFSFAGYVGQLVCMLVMFALLACHDIVDIASVSRSFCLFDENYVKTFAVRRTFNGLGCTLGWVVGMVMSFAFEGDALARVFICFALAVLLMIAASFAVFRPGPPSGTREGGASADQPVFRSFAEGSVEAALKMKTGVVADRYELTPRQAEVLCCLAQGRNAGYIADKFIISAHTAKSHIYNIYSKLGIHSQQELLDIVEAEEIPLKVLADSLGGELH